MKSSKEILPCLPMGVMVKPYSHQVDAFNFVCQIFGLIKTGGAKDADERSHLQDMRKTFSESK
jgi:hypothetical protein